MKIEEKTIIEAIGNFLWHCQFERKLDEKSIKAYETDLKQFAKGLDKNLNVYELSRNNIKKYLQQISPFKCKTIKRKLASLKAMLNYLEYEDDAFINPMRKMQIKIKEPERLPVVMTLEEVRGIFHYLYQIPIPKPTTDSYSYTEIAKIRDIAIIELLFASGMRVGELCALRNQDVDIHNGIVRIMGKGNKERIIYICHEVTITSLQKWNELKQDIDNPDEPFFTNRLHHGLSTQSVRNMVNHIIARTNIHKHVTPHTFRHTFATLLLEEDVDIRYIQNLLGHSSIATTQIYTHVNLNKQRQILQNKHPRRLI